MFLVASMIRQFIHQDDGISIFIGTITTSIFNSKFKESNENDMASHGICFDYHCRPKPSQIGQSNSVAANAHLAWCKLSQLEGTFQICLILIHFLVVHSPMFVRYIQDWTDFCDRLKNQHFVDISVIASHDGATENKQMFFGFKCLIRK